MNRKAKVHRITKETNILIDVNLDGSGIFEIQTGNGFFTHMLEQLSCHSNIDLNINASGDEQIDMHHQAEDTGIALGQAILQALGEKKGISRFGSFYAPMDESLTRCVIDLCGRSSFVWNVQFPKHQVGGFECEMIEHFFLSLASNLQCSLHIENLYGKNAHHIAESCFKAFARSIKVAIKVEDNKIPSTKGLI